MSPTLSFTEPEKPLGYRYKVVSMLDESFGEVVAKLKTKPTADSRYWDYNQDRDPAFTYAVLDMWTVDWQSHEEHYGVEVRKSAGKEAGGIVVKEEDKPSCLWCNSKLTPRYVYENGAASGKRVAVGGFGRKTDNLFCGINCGYKYAVWKMKKLQTQRKERLQCS